MNCPIDFIEIREELIFLLYAARLLRTNPMITKSDGVFIKVFDSDYVPDSFRTFMMDNAYSKVIEGSIPEVAIMLEIKILELQKDAAQKRLEEIKGKTNGK